eukprot:CAMPEP_0172508818 /NCGR_PEP_ID=MMETSP1066-20121228/215129_1 /TAXON_ID=671091 /ORGANISM="Coscinodiscus wailesii, Strain CCMP2513" /LENGTH=101 /DNA_ID=CAMNT_0013286997 /DNA_START=112 /DNA_END=414 /DNA_ORIENTATION=-
MAEFINYIISTQSPVDWSSIVLSVKSANTTLDNEVLHLACSADDDSKRAECIDIVFQLMQFSKPGAVESVDDKDGRTPIHRACVMAWDDLKNFENPAEETS